MYTVHVHFFMNLDLVCIDNARVIYRKIRYNEQEMGVNILLCVTAHNEYFRVMWWWR